jgi:hypothetical protein
VRSENQQPIAATQQHKRPLLALLLLGMFLLIFIDVLFGQVQLVEQLPDAVRWTSAGIGALLGAALAWEMRRDGVWRVHVAERHRGPIIRTLGMLMIPVFGLMASGYVVRQAVAYYALSGANGPTRLVSAPVIRADGPRPCFNSVIIRPPGPRAREINLCVTREARRAMLMSGRPCFALPVIEGRGGVLITRVNSMAGANYGLEDFGGCGVTSGG